MRQNTTMSREQDGLRRFGLFGSLRVWRAKLTYGTAARVLGTYIPRIEFAHIEADTFPLQEEQKNAGATVWPLVRFCTLYALFHSLLASRQAKELTERVVGSRYRNGLYRAGYNLLAVITTGLLMLKVARLPDRELYRVPPPWSWLMRVAQGAALLALLRTLIAIGIPQLAGLSQLITLLIGGEPEPEPEAQGPAPGNNGEMKVDGPFRYTRHPANWSPLALFLLFPNMTLRGAVIAILTAIYTVLGSKHEEYRLRVRYGEAYERYLQRVPFFWPRPER